MQLYRMRRALFVLGLTGLMVSTVSAEKMVKLEGIKIQGDNEAPQVMYIIPWQNSKGAERLYSPIRGAQIERLKPLDPYSFEREQSLHQQWVSSETIPVDPSGN